MATKKEIKAVIEHIRKHSVKLTTDEATKVMTEHKQYSTGDISRHASKAFEVIEYINNLKADPEVEIKLVETPK